MFSGHIHDYFIDERKIQQRPNIGVAGTATQQFSENNFLIHDVFAHETRVAIVKYDRRTFSFVVPESQILLPNTQTR